MGFTGLSAQLATADDGDDLEDVAVAENGLSVLLLGAHLSVELNGKRRHEIKAAEELLEGGAFGSLMFPAIDGYADLHGCREVHRVRVVTQRLYGGEGVRVKWGGEAGGTIA